jgi:hypothetical protein
MATTKRLQFCRKKLKRKRINKMREINISLCKKNRLINRGKKNLKDSVGFITMIWINRKGTFKKRCMLI